MYARVLRKWSLAKSLMYLWLPVVMLLVIWCQNVTSMPLSINTNHSITSMTLPSAAFIKSITSPVQQHSDNIHKTDDDYQQQQENFHHHQQGSDHRHRGLKMNIYRTRKPPKLDNFHQNINNNRVDKHINNNNNNNNDNYYYNHDRTSSYYHPYHIYKKQSAAAPNAATTTLPNVPNLNSQINSNNQNSNNRYNNDINNNNNNNNQNNNVNISSNLTSSANTNILNTSNNKQLYNNNNNNHNNKIKISKRKTRRHIKYDLPVLSHQFELYPSSVQNRQNLQASSSSSSSQHLTLPYDRQEQRSQQQQRTIQFGGYMDNQNDLGKSVETRNNHERYERIAIDSDNVHLPIANYYDDVVYNENNRLFNSRLELERRLQLESAQRSSIQQREKLSRIEAHRRHLLRFTVVPTPSAPPSKLLSSLHKIEPASISSLQFESPQAPALLLNDGNSKEYLDKDVQQIQNNHPKELESVNNDLNKLMIGRNRRDSRLHSNSQYHNNNNYYLKDHQQQNQQLMLQQSTRKRPKRYCSARDPTQLAFEAPTVFEGKVRSMSSDRRVNFSVTFEVKKIFKNQTGFKLPHLLRLQFTYRNTSECDIYRERLRPRGYVYIREDLEQGGLYILFVKQYGLGNFSILGQPIPKTKRAVKAVRIGASDKYAQPASIKSITTNYTRLQEGRELRIVCKVRGQPPPKVTWFKNNRSINRNRTLYQFLHLKKRSELIIRSFHNSDAGNYECRAKNKLTKRPDRRFIRIEAPPTRREQIPIHLSESPCPGELQKSYCFNGGICKFFMDIKDLACECQDGFRGDRCQTKEPTNLEPNPTYKSGYMADDPVMIDSDEEEDDTLQFYSEEISLNVKESLHRNLTILH